MTQQSAAVQLTGSPHVLIVDDEEGNRELMSDNLSELGYTCHTASCGDDALALLSKQEVQVALLDVMMPGMTGVEPVSAPSGALSQYRGGLCNCGGRPESGGGAPEERCL